MGKGRGGFSETCLLFSVVGLNALIGVFGLLLFSLSLWMRLESEVKDWVRELNVYQYWNGLYILMAAGIIIMIISFLGCCAAFSANSGLLMTASGLVFIAVILELAGGIYLIVHATESSKLTPYLETTFNKLMVDSNYNPEANRVLQVVQEKIGCCGANNYQDYQRNNLPVSDYCRDVVSGNIYQEGCIQQLSIFIEKRAGWLAGIALFVVALQVGLVFASVSYWRNIREESLPGQPKQYTEVSQNPY